MFNAGTATFSEFMMDEKLPLATIQDVVLEFLRGREDVVVFGAQAVNAYVNEPRMTQGIDLISVDAEAFANHLREYLHNRFHIAVRIRQVAHGRGLRIFQVQKEGNRHLVDIRAVDKLPGSERIANVLVMAPAELIASKVVSYHQRRGRPKSGTDWRDIALFLLEFPDLKQRNGLVAEHLKAAHAEQPILNVWYDLVEQEISPEEEDEEF
ncbi:MAG: nucleotidyl transferase AbiEii/AbiGii toxin family protein [Caldilineaceae bacterium]|nr:nucleotidyl transferase AbiEii/AbiGii toxin family protein [Caldilineaceae bacterium]